MINACYAQMKTRWLGILACVLIGVFIGMGAACAEGMQATEWAALAAANEPQPYGGLSLQETTPFKPINISPETWQQQLSAQPGGAAIYAFFQGMGLPLDAGECEWIDQNKDRAKAALWNESNSPCPFTVSTLCYEFPRNDGGHDNTVLVFMEQNGSMYLTDVLFAFGDLQAVTDAGHETVWLVGETGGAYNTVRWYNVQRRKIALAFVAEGLAADRVDVHIKVRAVADSLANGTLPEDGLLAIRKQVSVFDLTQATVSAEASEILLYTQVDVYACKPGGALTLVASKRFDGMDIPSVAGITCEQLISEKKE